MIDAIDSSKSNFTLKILKTRRRDEKNTNSIKNMTIFALNMSILLRCGRTRMMRNNVMLTEKVKEGGVSIFHDIIRSKDFNGL